jgi:hypothetical protein
MGKQLDGLRMPNYLQKITTLYNEMEDRVQLAGEIEQGGAVVISLTQRLLQRMIPATLKWLAGKEDAVTRGEVLQGFAQQAARAGLEPQVPVTASADSVAWLALEIDVTDHEHSLGLTFRGAGDDANAALILPVVALRQWLNIMHDTYVKAGWSLEQWPDWLREGAQVAPPTPGVLH